MDKIWLILSREYLSRVKKKSFLLTTLLTPLLFGGIYALAIYLAVAESDQKVVKVLDETGYFIDKLGERESVVFEYVDGSLEENRNDLESGGFDGLLYIRQIDIHDPKGINYYSMTTPGLDIVMGINRSLESVVRDIKIEQMGLSSTALDSLSTDISIDAINMSGETEKRGASGLAMAVGGISGVMIYMFMIVYGAQVMRGVMQEKSSKIVEILVSSVKPFQLMMGKILGIAAVGLTQFALWIILTMTLITVATVAMGPDAAAEVANAQPGMMQSPTPEEQNEVLQAVESMKENLNIPLIIGAFFFYFLSGYLFYASLFAMIGSAVDSEADSQQFMFPIMMPLIIGMMFLGVIIKDPSGPIAFWMSIIPFFSPIIMMIRMPFDVPFWELALSMVLMVAGFLATTWMAARVYRIGILMHGSKVNYKVIWKWMRMKN